MKTRAPDRQVALFRIQLIAGNVARVLDLYMRTDGFVVEEQTFGDGGTYADYGVPTGFQPDTWQRWTLELDATVNPAIGVLTLDGVERLRQQLARTYTGGTFNATLGTFYAPDGPTRDVWYDDVSLTILP